MSEGTSYRSIHLIRACVRACVRECVRACVSEHLPHCVRSTEAGSVASASPVYRSRCPVTATAGHALDWRPACKPRWPALGRWSTPGA